MKKKPHMTYNEKRLTNSLERVHMEQLKNTTDLLGLEDKNIKILSVLKYQTHLVVQAKLDSPRSSLSSLSREDDQIRLPESL